MKNRLRPTQRSADFFLAVSTEIVMDELPVPRKERLCVALLSNCKWDPLRLQRNLPRLQDKRICRNFMEMNYIANVFPRLHGMMRFDFTLSLPYSEGEYGSHQETPESRICKYIVIIATSHSRLTHVLHLQIYSQK